MAIAADRHLLFGLLALQNGLIDQAQLVAAFHAWTRDRARPLADHLVDRGALDADQRSALAAMAALHLKKFGDDPERSLAAIPAGRSTREGLAALGDPELTHTVGAVGSGSTDADAQATGTYSVGTATSDGQRFRIVRPHARGGLGAVFVALDGELHREVALKQMLDHHANDAVSRQRFLLEAEITGGLEHPGIVPVYGLGTYGDGRPFYAMRFIRGDSLKEAIGRSRSDESLKDDPGRRSVELRKLLRRFTDVCDAIGYAHSRGVLHRDIKPGNIIVGKHGETLVVDWGLAKATGRADTGAEERTLTPSSSSGSSDTLPGSALGTPAYMSPEQARGDLDALGAPSDVYSLGSTLYYVLTGSPPFEGDDMGALLRDVQRGEFPPPRKLDPSVDPALEAVCLKAMALKPEDRYPSTRALAEDVERWMADEPVTAWREPWSRTLTRWLARHRTGVTAIGAAVLVALAGTAAVLAVQTRANGELKRKNLELAASNQRERDRFALAQEAIRTFHTGVSEDVLLKQEEFKALRTKLLQGARDFYRKLEALLQGHEDRDSRLALGRAYYEVGELTRRLDSIAEAEAVLRRALDLFEALSREDPADPEARLGLARNLRALATILSGVGRREDAMATIDRSREIFRALAEADPSDLRRRLDWAAAENSYASTLVSLGRPASEAVEAAERALSIIEAAAGAGARPEDLRVESARIYGALAMALERAERPDESIAAYRRAVDLGETVFRANPEGAETTHELARNLGNMGIGLTRLGRHAEALAAFDRAREVIRAGGAVNPTLILFPAASAWMETAAAESLAALGRDAEALQALGRAREARERLIQANPSVVRNREQLLRVHWQAGEIHRRAGRMAEALASYEAARNVAAGLLADHPTDDSNRATLAWAWSHVGDQLIQMGRPADALVCLDEAVAVSRRIAGPGAPTDSSRTYQAQALRFRGIAAQRCGRPAEAASDFRRAIALLRELARPAPIDIYDIACCQSLLSAIETEADPDPSSDADRAEADRAIATLRRAFAAGWHDPNWARTDTDLDPIRARPDFRLLMMDAAFPADPFLRRSPSDGRR